MASSYLESKIMDLQARLRAENEANERDNLAQDISGGLSSPRHGSGRRPRQLGEMGTPRKSLKQLDLPVGLFVQPKSQDTSEIENKMKEIMQLSGILCINGKKYHTEIKDLEHLGELGNGTCGHVVKMLHKPSQTVIAVKQMRRSGNSEENKRIIMDLDVVLKSHDCPYIVQCLGCFITEADVWICMELMATCFDKLLKRVRNPVPENMLGKVTLATVKALHYLKESHDVIHRDVKPSNILLDERGNVKLCDFGISGRLVDSKAKTKNAGCAAYMAPERIDPPDPRKPAYDIRADVWSLGITLVELATGVFPYRDCKCDFEVLSKVMQDDPPSLPADQSFSQEFQDFVKCCLTKNYRHRPKYRMLLEHPFLKRYETEEVDVASWFATVMAQCEAATRTANINQRFTPPPPSPSARRHVPSPLHHHRSLSETGTYQSNGDTPSGRFSPFRMADPPPVSPRYNATPPPPDWDRNRGLSGGIMGSPILNRKRYTTELERPIIPNHNHPSPHVHPPLPHGNSSPLVLQRYYHQQGQHLTSYPITQLHHRSASLSPCRQYTSEVMKVEESSNSVSGGGKKRFSSFVKLQVGGGLPPSGAPHSPEPPPRHNRGSPLLMRRHQAYLESVSPSTSPSPVRRVFPEASSPSLPRRYVSPSPPQPPPRRLSECSSVPGSPQHTQRRPARFHYTPEPQRKVWATSDLHDL